MQEKSKEYNEKEQQVAENRSRNTLFERRENLQKHESYASERRQYDAIRNGQTDRIQSVFQLTPDGTPGILSRNELRNSKNMFIAGITLFTRAAIEGGVPEETAREALRLAMNKLPNKTKFVARESEKVGENDEDK